MDRETGTATQPCATCGTELAVIELAPGQTSTVTCDNCYGPAATEQASALVMEREFGVDASEQESDSDGGEDD